ncbi:MAG TPA: hypothetical protein VII06_37145 [Chloroflexota bacterium]|jgi:hypothetical protein
MNRILLGLRRSVVVGAVAVGFAALPSGRVHAQAAPAPASAVQAQDAASVLATGLHALNDFAAASQAALASGDTTAARAAYAQFDSGWDDIEDGVRDRSRDDYRSIEDAMREVDRALRADPVNADQVNQWLAELQNRVNKFVATLTNS